MDTQDLLRQVLSKIESAQERAEVVADEVRYRSELLDDEERMLLLDRIRRLRKTVGALVR